MNHACAILAFATLFAGCVLVGQAAFLRRASSPVIPQGLTRNCSRNGSTLLTVSVLMIFVVCEASTIEADPGLIPSGWGAVVAIQLLALAVATELIGRATRHVRSLAPHRNSDFQGT